MAMSETPEQTAERRARAIVSEMLRSDKRSTTVDYAQAVATSDEQAGMVLVDAREWANHATTLRTHRLLGTFDRHPNLEAAIEAVLATLPPPPAAKDPRDG